MLDAETKKHIDNARDVLVGKVPDPKSQIEQITIALIYKFMDDMDAESIQLGGKASFFTGKYKEYSWATIMNPKVGGSERRGLYAAAIESMSTNKNLPQLFRDIFKDAVLPYKDFETLNLFLKEISWFDYEHSENLGNAFEYLLSIMGSQGDAGQFRTPRHIIDFMVEVIAPKKNETILDPACGTAGFLISAYNYIMNQNTKKVKGDKLTPDDRKKLAKNINGYDISPDMVRLSRVNLFLHKFENPQILEYDTLTSETFWDDNYDVILANPPFMTPKGGIRPHKRFAIHANRAEVLFVDYIMEHISLKGRAAVIVPEGIIFQSANAYTALRKKMVEENFLWAVVSLPAGVFNPYAGVKTSILFFDKNIAKKVKDILFVKVSNDGYDLGAQRREIEKNDLSQAVEMMKKYIGNIEIGAEPNSKEIKKSSICEVVMKTKLAGNEEYNLTGDSHKILEIRTNQKWPTVKLQELVDYIRGVTYSKEDESKSADGYCVLRANNIDLKTGKLFLDDLKRVRIMKSFKDTQKLLKNDILMCSASGSKEHVGKVAFSDSNTEMYFGGFMGVLRTKETINAKFLFTILQNEKFRKHLLKTSVGASIQNLNAKTIGSFDVPLPTLKIQQDIVTEIEGYQKIIDGARMVVENWKPRIDIDPSWPMVRLGEVCKVTGELTRKIKLELPYIGADSIEPGTGQLFQRKSAKEQGSAGPVYFFQGKKLLYSKIRPYLNKLCITEFQGYCSSDMYPLEFDNAKMLYEYAFYYMLSDSFMTSIKGFYERASIPKINREQLFSVSVPAPTIEVQQNIIKVLGLQEKAVISCIDMITIYEDKIKQVVNKVWA